MAKEEVRVVVVDDDDDASSALALALELDGYSVKTAQDARQALVLVADYQPHCVLMDLGLPDMDGCELARQLREPRHGAGAGRRHRAQQGRRTLARRGRGHRFRARQAGQRQRARPAAAADRLSIGRPRRLEIGAAGSICSASWP
jgi:CheY-like chemotaxis protein